MVSRRPRHADRAGMRMPIRVATPCTEVPLTSPVTPSENCLTDECGTLTALSVRVSHSSIADARRDEILIDRLGLTGLAGLEGPAAAHSASHPLRQPSAPPATRSASHPLRQPPAPAAPLPPAAHSASHPLPRPLCRRSSPPKPTRTPARQHAPAPSLGKRFTFPLLFRHDSRAARRG